MPHSDPKSATLDPAAGPVPRDRLAAQDDARRLQSIERTGSEPSWEHPRAGDGNWLVAPDDMVDRVREAAESWRGALSGVVRPWLCWCVDEEWSVAQQRLVADAGWTPVVGSDSPGRVGSLVDGAIAVDFAGDLGLVKMRPHFVIEFAFLLADRLAYWHSDVLLPPALMREAAQQFEWIAPGGQCGVVEKPGLGTIVERWRRGHRLFWSRVFEVIGCVTAEASRSQFDEGLGLWRNTHWHPHAGPAARRSPPHYEFGVGWGRWARRHPESFTRLGFDIEPYHFTQINNPGYKSVVDPRDKRRFKGEELRRNYDLQQLCRELGIGP
ncbi:hypothetical protein Mal64_01190 [Pseudobythopirellula maris]|uniref:Uncharacterized protein n=1 Tax=Pseudobythopirellula maris TaxID=2527991 RepID=A0A5C5ZR32_9BACT|nr:hypothetical protein [Pseudobythopirellula maris]TWT89740.1 hypothetical protein Mal64_01190 [Pseudobythopirellula maris]